MEETMLKEVVLFKKRKDTISNLKGWNVGTVKCASH